MYWTAYKNLVDRTYPLLQSEQLPTNKNNPETEEDYGNTNNVNKNDLEQELSDLVNKTENSDGNQVKMEDKAIIYVHPDGNLKVNCTQLENYLLREPELCSLSIWEYTSIIEKIYKKMFIILSNR